MRALLAIVATLRDDSQSFFNAYYRRGSRRILRNYFFLKDRNLISPITGSHSLDQKIKFFISWLWRYSFLSLSAIIIAIIWIAWMTLPLFISFLIYLGDEF